MQELALADRERHIHRIAADDHGQRTAVRSDHVAFGQFGAADLAGDWRGDLGVAQVDVGGLQVGIGDDHVALGAFLIGNPYVEQRLGGGVGLGQFLCACALRGGVGEFALRLKERALRLLHRRLERVRLDPVENVAFLDDVALLEQDLLEETRHARADLHPFDSLHAPDEFGRLGDRPQLGRQDADGDGGGLLCRNLGSRRDDAEQGDQTAQGDGMDLKTHRLTPSVSW